MNQDPTPEPLRGIRLLIALWSVAGVLLLLLQAVARLAPLAWEPVAEGSMSALHWSFYLASIVLNAYAEGYKGFQKGFAPRVAARAVHLARNPRPLHVILAPAFAMGLLHATRRRLITSWSVLLGVVGLVVLMRLAPQPWRGIVDAGVVVGLVWGILAVIWFFAAGMRGTRPTGPVDLPRRREEVSAMVEAA